ncbi:MAG TPA: hypothetical protein DEO40_02405 [Treponema sp.]|nr:hypothetical protein [Treponema sp.]HAK68148.1 hypothetical protein [Treponema sp.]HBB43017.1 hypothetical protein [Treponema sp.]HCA19512.1 hypothetical protein [Treponema sp.]
MKKILSFLAAALLSVGIAAAQVSASDPKEAANPQVDTSTQVRQIEDKYESFHPSASKVEIELEYTPLTGEVIVYYTCMGASYDQGEAMNTIDAVLEDFAIENQFTKKPTIVKKDRTRWYKDGRDIRMVNYRRWARYDVR